MKRLIFRLAALFAFTLLVTWNIGLTFYCDALQRAVFELVLYMDNLVILVQKDARNMSNITILLEEIEELNSIHIKKVMR